MSKTKVPSLVTILILSVITVFFWIGLDVYRALTVKPAPIVPAEVLNPLEPSLDEETLNEIENRVYIAPELISPIPLNLSDDLTIPTPTPLPTSQPQTPLPTSEPVTLPSNTPISTP